MMDERKTNDFEEIFDVILAFYKERDYYDLLGSILAKMMDITHADGGTLYVLEDEKLHFRIMRNISQNIYLTAKDEIDAEPISLNEKNIQNISAYAAINNEIISIDDVYNNTEFDFAGPKAYDSEHGYHAKSMLVFPLSATGSSNKQPQVIGVIQLINSINPATGEIENFGDIYNPPVLPALSNISANALANILYMREIQELFSSFVRVMTKAIDERSPYNVNHTNNVAKYCGAFALYLGSHLDKKHPLYFDDNRREQLVMAAYLHDIGKLITPLEIMDKSDRLGYQLPVLRLKLQLKYQQIENLFAIGKIDENQRNAEQAMVSKAKDLMEISNIAPSLTMAQVEEVKQLAALVYKDENGQEARIFSEKDISSLSIRYGTLTLEERKIMQDHVRVTERLLDQMTFNHYYKDVPVWASGHHEYIDGTGYPHGLLGAEVSPEMSILCMVDIFDALTAIDRPYKKALSAQDALKNLYQMVDNGKLPKDIVDLFAASEVWNEID